MDAVSGADVGQTRSVIDADFEVDGRSVPLSRPWLGRGRANLVPWGAVEAIAGPCVATVSARALIAYGANTENGE
jgi:hypothetical protein